MTSAARLFAAVTLSSTAIVYADSSVAPTPTAQNSPGVCGLSAAAFCDTFDAPSATHGRAGELNPSRWSAGRLAPNGPTASGAAFPVGAAQLGACRAGLPALVFPDNDTLICDLSDDIQSNHLLVAVAAQNYGENSYRIRQPFDFSGRTGKIVFDAEGSNAELLWISVEVTEDPIAVPSFAFFVNNEGGVLPRNGLELQFDTTCGEAGIPDVFTLHTLQVFNNYADTVYLPSNPVCLAAQRGKLNHFEVSVSQQQVSVSATPYSTDGVHFAVPTLLFSTGVQLPFTRGYVHITAHNHASLKYSTGTWAGNDGATNLDATLSHWDNIGFDGPVITNWREYEVADSLTPAQDPNDDPNNPTRTAVNLGYLAPDVMHGPSATLTLKGIDLTGVVSARLALTAWYPSDQPSVYVLKYRFNGGPWRDRPLSAGEAALYKTPSVIGLAGITPAINGAIGQMLDVSIGDFVSGDNTLEFVTAYVPQNYPPGVVNVDLVLQTGDVIFADGFEQ